MTQRYVDHGCLLRTGQTSLSAVAGAGGRRQSWQEDFNLGRTTLIDLGTHASPFLTSLTAAAHVIAMATETRSQSGAIAGRVLEAVGV